MITELLVLLACTERQGCSETTAQYYGTHPEVKQSLKHQGNRVKDMVGPEAVAIYPAIMWGIRGQGTFGIGPYFSLKLSLKDDSLLIFKYSF